MVMLQSQASIDTKILLRDYKEIFKITRLINARKILYMNYNMNCYLNPKSVIIKSILRKFMQKVIFTDQNLLNYLKINYRKAVYN